MNLVFIESDVPLQLILPNQVVLKIPARTRIEVGETIQIKKKPGQGSTKKPQSAFPEEKEPETHEPMSWNNIQLVPDVGTGQLTPLPPVQPIWSSQPLWPLPYSDSQLAERLPPLDLTPSTRQIIDEIRDMNLWSEPMTPEEQEESEEVDIMEDLELELEPQEENERSDSRDTAEVLSEYDIYDNCDNCDNSDKV